VDAVTNAALAADAAQRSIPLPAGDVEYQRVRATRARRSMLEGTWARLLAERTDAVLGTARASMQADPSLSINPFKSVCRALSVLYDTPPVVQHATATADDLRNLTRALTDSGLWPMMQRVQQYTLGLREMFVHAAVDPESGRLRVRAVYPDLMLARAAEGTPDQPARIEELRLRSTAYLRERGVIGGVTVGDQTWTVDVYDLTGPQPYHAVYVYASSPVPGSWGLGSDITAAIYGRTMTGPDYPWRATPTVRQIAQAERTGQTPEGTPVLPYVIYHAAPNGDRLFDPFDWQEIVDGTLTCGVLHGFLLHTFADASWPQKYLIGGVPAGAAVTMAVEEGQRRSYIPADPTSVLMVDTLPGFTGQPSAGQFAAGGDIAVQEQVLGNLISALMESAGISPSDVQRLSGNARSGAAIALTNEGKRELQRRYQAIFEAADQRLVRLCAILLNRYSDAVELAAEAEGAPIPPRYRYPEGGYALTYPRIPRSPDELKAHREHVLSLLSVGFYDKAEAYAALHDVPLEVAERRVREIAAEAAPPAPMPPTPSPAQPAPARRAAAPAPAAAPAMPERDSLRDAIEDALDEIDDGASPAEIRAILADLIDKAEDKAEDEDTDDPATNPPEDAGA
jgi:hypothetical protein